MKDPLGWRSQEGTSYFVGFVEMYAVLLVLLLLASDPRAPPAGRLDYYVVSVPSLAYVIYYVSLVRHLPKRPATPICRNATVLGHRPDCPIQGAGGGGLSDSQSSLRTTTRQRSGGLSLWRHDTTLRADVYVRCGGDRPDGQGYTRIYLYYYILLLLLLLHTAGLTDQENTNGFFSIL